ncbi:MAG: hypothetical protein OIF48_16225 [Silicimonas sp.]|nr:hypothetical protein [Silicimonas sp.]
MDVLSLLIQLIFRSLFVLLPLTVAWLALRRVLRSRSTNAWGYGVVCLLTASTAAALVPWTLGVGSAGWVAFAISAVSPALWIAVLMVCDPVDQPAHYDVTVAEAPEPPPEAPKFDLTAAIRVAETLDVERVPDEPEEDPPVPVFRHRPPKPRQTVYAPPEEPGQSLMQVAKQMRGNRNSDRHRPRRLAAPDRPAPERYGKDLPFLTRP